MSIHQIFNTEYSEFIQKISKAVPKERENIDDHFNQFRAFMKVNVRGPINMFLNTSHPFAKQIFEKDSLFFIQHDDLADGFKENGMSLSLLGKEWDLLSPQSQSSMWQYLQNLLILAWQWVGINTFDKDLLKKIIDDSPSWIPEGKLTEDFPNISEALANKYTQK